LPAWRQASLQYLTRSQSRAHFFRQVNGRPQVGQIFSGRLALDRGMASVPIDQSFGAARSSWPSIVATFIKARPVW
jgi:hypothetical protein